jgi:hypothetical protein
MLSSTMSISSIVHICRSKSMLYTVPAFSKLTSSTADELQRTPNDRSLTCASLTRSCSARSPLLYDRPSKQLCSLVQASRGRNYDWISAGTSYAFRCLGMNNQANLAFVVGRRLAALICGRWPGGAAVCHPPPYCTTQYIL